MPQSLASVYLHLVFSTKAREPFLADKSVRDALHEYLGAISNRMRITPVSIGGAEDHVHILGRMGRIGSIAEWVKELKRSSSLWMHHKEGHSDFYWQTGYGVFSIGRTELDRIVAYIHRQEEHHRKISFRVEYLDTLRKYQVEYDEKQLWD